MDAEIVHRSRRAFPREPVRALDAVHLATALAVRNIFSDVRVLTPDDRIRSNAAVLGFDVVPSLDDHA